MWPTIDRFLERLTDLLTELRAWGWVRFAPSIGSVDTGPLVDREIPYVDLEWRRRARRDLMG